MNILPDAGLVVEYALSKRLNLMKRTCFGFTRLKTTFSKHHQPMRGNQKRTIMTEKNSFLYNYRPIMSHVVLVEKKELGNAQDLERNNGSMHMTQN